MSLPIESIETLVVQLPTRADFRWNGLSRPLGEVLVVRVRSGSMVGYGETVPLPDWGGPEGAPFGETPRIGEVVLHELVAPSLIGLDAERPGAQRAAARRAVIGYPYALAALDIALHDIRARNRGVPVYDLLGGRCRDSVPIAHMIGLMSLEAAHEEAVGALAEGCRAFQVKGGQDVRRDVELIERLRSLAGPDVSLRLDANCGYGDWKSAAAATRALADAGADLVEQPVGDHDALSRVTEASRIPIVADEACWSPQDALRLVRDRAADAFSIYVAKSGGFAEAMSVARIAAAAGLPHDLNGSLEAGIGNAASLQVAAASEATLLPSVLPINGPAHDLPTGTLGRYFVDDVVTEGMTVRDGAVVVSDAPGLGVDVDTEKLEAMSIRRRITGSDYKSEELVS
jgi:L-alanine-DL-glutamate epimerase-like enolase superfamily enzyme